VILHDFGNLVVMPGIRPPFSFSYLFGAIINEPTIYPSIFLTGIVDSHVHINDPGRTAWEGFPSATRAAAAGGVTTVVDMPLNSSPVTTTLEALRIKQAHTRNKLWVDVGALTRNACA